MNALLGVKEGVLLRAELFPLTSFTAITWSLKEANAARREDFGNASESLRRIKKMLNDVETTDGVELLHRQINIRKKPTD